MSESKTVSRRTRVEHAGSRALDGFAIGLCCSLLLIIGSPLPNQTIVASPLVWAAGAFGISWVKA